MIDALGEKSPRDHDEFWIEITDSQLKFEGHDKDKTHPDTNRVTFEVVKCSKTLTSSYLNFQLIPILIDGGVPSHVFERLLKEDLTAKVAALECAMDDGLRLRQWNQENNSVTMERLRSKTVEMTGGLPSSAAERINWFTEVSASLEHHNVVLTPFSTGSSPRNALSLAIFATRLLIFTVNGWRKKCRLESDVPR